MRLLLLPLFLILTGCGPSAEEALEAKQAAERANAPSLATMPDDWVDIGRDRPSDGNRAGVTLEGYYKITTGMTYAEVVKILGKPSQEMSSSDIAGIRTVMYMWDAGNYGGNMNAMFQNGKLVQKAQFGLE
jgi:hypothetical protein